ncbi:AI-2E family transporter [Patescibacteria group bacterium]|nr:AI-2E family transporter [Patescibacteria group bacterium]
MDKQKFLLDISILSILKIVGVLIALWFLYFIKDILAMLFVAIVLAAAIDPFVTILEKRKIPRGFGVMIIYVILLLIVLMTIAMIIPPMITEISSLTTSFPKYWEKIIEGYDYVNARSSEQAITESVGQSLDSIQLGLQKASSGIFSFIISLFGGIFSFMLVFVISFYLLVSEEAIKKIFKSIAPANYYPYLSSLFVRMQKKIGDWLRAELILMISIAIFSFVGFKIFGIKYALVLAIIAGLFEIIPYVGPVLAAIPAVFLSFVDSPWKAVAIIIWFVIMQQVENHILVPKVMQKTVGLNPVVIIVVLLIGARLFGVVGMILSVPVATAISLIIKDFYQSTQDTIKHEGKA